jgi:hypothetical protein
MCSYLLGAKGSGQRSRHGCALRIALRNEKGPKLCASFGPLVLCMRPATDGSEPGVKIRQPAWP